MIRSAAVLGAGTMGAQIAAHLANAGVPTVLLDLTTEVARQGLARARALKPDPFFTPDAIALVTTAGFDDLSSIGGADWIVEAVVEDLAVKRTLLERVEAARRPGSIVSSNTSGIPVGAIADGRGEEFRRHWLGTHFFNPPRYLRLLEVIPTADTDPAVVAGLSRFADLRLGKGVVIARDTPNFIANRIGLYGLIPLIRALASGEHTIEEIDAMTGPALGRPKSATFRTMDIAGIDVLGHVVRNLAERLPDEETRRAFALPPLVDELIARGWVGEKGGRGFYERRRQPDGSSEILTLDPATFTYRPKRPARLPALDAARAIDDAAVRLRTLFLGRDAVGDFLRRTLGPTLLYAARVAPEIAYSIDDVDRAMQWGFGWELGPFEICDAIGLRELLEALGQAAAPPLIEDVLARAAGRRRPADLEGRQGPAADCPEERRRQPRRSRRRRARRRISFEDERHRRRHPRDAARRRADGRGRLRGARRWQRRCALFGWSELVAAAPGRAGRRVGRDRQHGPGGSGSDVRAPLRERSGGGVSRGHDPRRRM
jgi:3-hydroxyacyl-CoA dehydrogenase